MAGVAGALIGAVIAAALWAGGVLDRSRAPVSVSAPASVQFVAAWRHHLLASWSVDVVTTRSSGAATPVRVQVHEAQRPPDSIRIGGGAAAAIRGDRVLACATADDGNWVCRSAPSGADWATRAANELAGIARLVGGPTAPYTVSVAGPGCYELRLRSGVASPTWGRRAAYCLDAGTGAVLRSEVDRGTVSDVAVTVSMHAPATDADLALPPGAVIR